MFREEFVVRRGSLKIVSVDTETRRSSKYYEIKYAHCVHKYWLVNGDMNMIYGTYDIIQQCPLISREKNYVDYCSKY